MFAYSMQGSSVEVINFLRLICLEVTNSHINGIPVRQEGGAVSRVNIRDFKIQRRGRQRERQKKQLV